ncbi:MAG: DNA-binding response regulator [Dermatophilaceae bacterium]
MTEPVKPRPTAVVVDDSRAVQLGLPLMAPDIDFVAAYPDIETLLADCPAVDVVVLDLKLADGGRSGVRQGPAAIRAVAKAGYRICLYTDERRRLVLAQCLRAGAHGVVHKSDSDAVTAAAIDGVARGETVITQSLVGLAEVVERRGGLPQLTARQRDVLRARARGERWADIAARLYITEGVAREHMAAVNAKFALYLYGASPADMERQLGMAPGDLLDE